MVKVLNTSKNCWGRLSSCVQVRVSNASGSVGKINLPIEEKTSS